MDRYKLALYRSILDEFGATGSINGFPSSKETNGTMLGRIIKTGRDPAKWHLSIALRGMFRNKTMPDNAAVAGVILKEKYVKSVEVNEQNSILYILLNDADVLRCAVECAQAIECKHSLTDLFDMDHRTVIFKWTDKVPSISSYRSSISADLMARSLFAYTRLSRRNKSESNLPKCYQILRDRDIKSEHGGRVGDRIFASTFVRTYMPEFLAKLRATGFLYPSVESADSPPISLSLPGTERVFPIVDKEGTPSTLAIDSCVLFVLLKHAQGSSGSSSSTVPSETEEHWLHYIPDSRRLLHWQNVISVADLAIQNDTGCRKYIKNLLCPVGDVVGVPQCSTKLDDNTESSQRAAHIDKSTSTFIQSLGIDFHITDSVTVDDTGLKVQENAASDENSDPDEQDIMLTALHCEMLSTPIKNKCAIKSIKGTTDGSFLQYNHARLVRICAQNPKSGAVRGIDLSLIREPEAMMVAHLIAQFPEILRSVVISHEPASLLAYYSKFAHAVSKAAPVLRVKDIDSDLANVRAELFYAAKAIIALGITLIGSRPLSSM